MNVRTSMHLRGVVVAVAAAAIGVTGCVADVATSSDAHHASMASTLLDTVADRGAYSACNNLRWVAYRAGAKSCPTIPRPRETVLRANGTFVGSRLFTLPWDSSKGDPSQAPALEGFCSYEFKPDPGLDPSTPPGPLYSFPNALTDTLKGWRVHSDCQVVSALATPLADDPNVYGPLIDNTRIMVDRPATLPVAPAPKRVRVAVLDSSTSRYSSGAAGPGRYQHGWAVGRVIRDLSCPGDADVVGQSCIAHVANQCALSMLNPYRDAAKGIDPDCGFFGTHSNLARSIGVAVDAWYRQNRRPSPTDPVPQPRLVLNLSVGWEPGYGAGDDPATMDANVLAVHTALRHAACRGALVVVAAGNASGGEATRRKKGVMYPGAWEAMRAPTREECLMIEGGTYDPTGGPYPAMHAGEGARPLVYAVSGVDGNDSPLPNSRPSASTKLAAYGYEVTVPGGAGAGHTPIFTGSSMAAAVVSGVAATVWGYWPGLTPGDVMKRVYATGTDLGTPADFCFPAGTSCGETTHRVSLCRALSGCVPGTGCVDTCEAPDAGEGSNPSWDAAWSTYDPTLPSRRTAVGCGSCRFYAEGRCVSQYPACPAPFDTLPTKSTQPWIDPQPGRGGCDACSLSAIDDSSIPTDADLGSLVLTASLDPDLLATGALERMVLTLYGIDERRYDFAIDIPAGTPQFTVPIPLVAGAIAPRSPTVSFRIHKPGMPAYSTNEPVPLYTYAP